MLIKEVLTETRTAAEHVYHASYLPNLLQGLRSIAQRGLQPSKSGYSGPGVYFAYDPEGGFYHVSPEEATLFRVRWQDLVKLYGVYPENSRGIQRDENEIIVPGPVPAKFLEVEYFPGEWWTIQDAMATERGPVD